MIELSAGHPLAIGRLAFDAFGRLLFPRFDQLVAYSLPLGVESVVARDITSPAEFRVSPSGLETLVVQGDGLLRIRSADGPGESVSLPTGCSLFWPIIAPAADVVFSRGRIRPQLVDIPGHRVHDFRPMPPRLPHADALFPEGERLLTVHPTLWPPLPRYRITVRTVDRDMNAVELRSRRVGVSQVSPAGRVVALGTGLQAVMWWPESGALKPCLSEETSFVRCLAFDADADRLLVGRTSGVLEVFDVATGKLLHVVHRVGAAVTAVAWSPDGLTIAAGTNDGRILLIDAAA